MSTVQFTAHSLLTAHIGTNILHFVPININERAPGTNLCLLSINRNIALTNARQCRLARCLGPHRTAPSRVCVPRGVSSDWACAACPAHVHSEPRVSHLTRAWSTCCALPAGRLAAHSGGWAAHPPGGAAVLSSHSLRPAHSSTDSELRQAWEHSRTL